MKLAIFDKKISLKLKIVYGSIGLFVFLIFIIILLIIALILKSGGGDQPDIKSYNPMFNIFK